MRPLQRGENLPAGEPRYAGASDLSGVSIGHSSWATTMDTYGHILSATDDGVTDRLDTMLRATNGTPMERKAPQRHQPGR